MERIYLDANATTPLDPRVREAMIPWLDAGNASSPHAEGRAARAAIDEAREKVAMMIGAHPREVIFTGGATESNALALLGTIAAYDVRHTACTAIEHPAVLRTLESSGTKLSLIPVDAQGHVDPAFVVPDDVGLLSVMLANNETGTILPVSDLAASTKAITHCDAVQACGKMAVDVGELGVDLLALSAHKMGGPKGVGALWVRRGVRIAPLAHGGEHERGLRPGTENVAAIVGLGASAEYAAMEWAQRDAHWRALSGELIPAIRAVFPDAIINSPDTTRIANTVSVTFADVEGEAILLGLDLEGVAVATGSACSSGAAEASHVLRALGQSNEQAERSIRISMHAHTTREEVERFLPCLERVVKNLRALAV
ncbi:MAG: cysteine desulfurase family protein [Planctomycetota bacterium]